jgi:crotonobetainyl-CoA:carnitine CoA-transferase CaiB-like acyl-CoA transferase
MNLASMDKSKFDSLIAALDMEWAREDPQFSLLPLESTGAGRYAHTVHHLWDRALEKFSVDEATEIVESHGGLVFPMNDYRMIENNEQVRAIGMIQTVEQPGAGAIKELIPPWDFADTPCEIRLPAPRLGEHTAEVLRELGYSQADVERLSGGRAALLA